MKLYCYIQPVGLGFNMCGIHRNSLITFISFDLHQFNWKNPASSDAFGWIHCFWWVISVFLICVKLYFFQCERPQAAVHSLYRKGFVCHSCWYNLVEDSQSSFILSLCLFVLNELQCKALWSTKLHWGSCSLETYYKFVVQ